MFAYSEYEGLHLCCTWLWRFKIPRENSTRRYHIRHKVFFCFLLQSS